MHMLCVMLLITLGTEVSIMTFFKTIDELLKTDNISKESIAVLNNLDSFIRSGVVASSPVDKFVLKNYNLGAVDICVLWNSSNPDNKKSVDSIRGRLSTLSRHVNLIFRLGVEDFKNAFMGNDVEVLRGISGILKAFETENMSTQERFIFVESDTESEMEYSLDECKEEVLLLQALDKIRLLKLIKNVDEDKLNYLIGLLNTPLLSNEYVKVGDKGRKVRVPVLNTEKMALLEALDSSDSETTFKKQKSNIQFDEGVDYELSFLDWVM